jgi:glyoxylase-like metal-dependent hydrolase (beta-lactamase superfamily II)
MAMLHGEFTLLILKTHNKRTKTTRYVAEVKKGPKPVGYRVTVKFKNCGHLPDEFLDKIGKFYGDENDIRDVGDEIDQRRKNKPFPNPFICSESAQAPEPQERQAPFLQGNAIGEKHMIFRINDAGDACCIQVGISTLFNLMIDFGFSSRDKFNLFQKRSNRENSFLNNLIISHYHTDHFCGLEQLKGKGPNYLINNVYIPAIPSINEGIDVELKKYIAFHYYMQCGARTGSYFYDIKKMIADVNLTEAKIKEVKQGDKITINDAVFEVIWPPSSISDGSLGGLKNAMENIDQYLERNGNLKQLWECYKKQQYCNSIEEIQSSITQEEKNGISKLISAAADHFSICLYLPESFLFLGDITCQEINPCIDYFLKTYHQSHISLFIPPHHGTRWADNMRNISPYITVINNGIKMNKHFRVELFNIQKPNTIFSTFYNKSVDIVFPATKYYPDQFSNLLRVSLE